MSKTELETIIWEAEHGPTGDQLVGAPILEIWYLIQTPDRFIRARGEVVGHPWIDDPYVTTSPVLGFNAEAGWMRTRSRFYRLGHPIDLGPAMSVVGSVTHEYAQRYLAKVRKDVLGAASVH